MSDINKEKNSLWLYILIPILVLLSFGGIYLLLATSQPRQATLVPPTALTVIPIATVTPTATPLPSTVDISISTPVYDNQYIIVWDKTVTAPEKSDAIEQLPDFSIVESIDTEFLVVRYNGSSLTQTEILETLGSIPGVICADPNYIVSIESISNDIYSDAQWALETNGFYKHYDSFPPVNPQKLPIKSDIDINYVAAMLSYEVTIENPREVIVAVIDTGIDINHEDLAENIWINPGEIPDDGIDNDGNGYIDDFYGWDFYNNDNTLVHYGKGPDGKYLDNDDHGTHVAGIIAAVTNNEIGVAGAASFIPLKIMPLKINGGARSNGTVAAAIKAINYATAMGANVCNMSWGSTGIASSLESLKAAMSASDMLFVSAAGNEGSDNDEKPMYPASIKLPNNIAVTYLDQFGRLVAQSTVGSEPNIAHVGSNYGVNSVDLGAPGVYIVSTLTENRYGASSGSSVAAPFVSAIAAVLYSTNDNLYPSEIKDLILSTVKTATSDEDGNESPLPNLDELAEKLAVPGIPDMFAALSHASELQQDTVIPELTITRSFEGEIIVLSAEASDELSGVRVLKYVRTSSEDDLLSDSFFHRGTIGTDYSGPIRLAKSGYYCFYVSDSAGNERVINFVVEDDVTAPKIELLTTTLSPSGVTLSVLDVSEYESGLNKFLLLPGERTVADFLDSNESPTELTAIDGRLLLRLGDEDVYTLYASDYRGNVEVYVIRKTEE